MPSIVVSPDPIEPPKKKFVKKGRRLVFNLHYTQYPIVKIIRQQKDFSYDYEIFGSDVRISSNHKTEPDILISRSAFENAAKVLDSVG